MHPYLNIAVKAIRSAAKFLIDATLHINFLQANDEHKNKPHLIENTLNKVENNLITNILRAYPMHNISSINVKENNNSAITWIINPLNGISNFIYKIPFFAISIAVCKDNIIEHGVIYNPILDELFVCSKGHGAQLNNKKIRVSANKDLSYALIALQNKSLNINHQEQFHYFARNFGSEALHLAFVAAGRLDGYYGMDVNALAIPAGILLIKESGGYVTDIDPLDETIINNKILASNPKIYSKLHEIVAS